ncbi:MAG TPA: NUDIX domain-containing protein [Propionibacteriaceae bacterium]|nr:NUDIX domain-containing protein [Propionibacteriaceae bacterium]
MALLVVGVTADGGTTFSAPLGHGADPETVVFDQGYRALRPLEAKWQGDDLELRVRVRPAQGEPRPEPLSPRTDAGLIISDDVVPVTRQRVAAYAVVLSQRGLLATEYSNQTAVPGRWGMPGGGLDDHESPVQCVRREVTEETAQQIVLGDLTKVQTGHWIGRLPGGMIEDFHAVRLVYRANCPKPTDPVVLDHGGSTASARWVGLDDWTGVGWTANWMMILSELLPTSEV